MDIAQEIGAKIRYYRKQQHMTVDQLALAVGKSKSSISKYEQGQIVIDILSLYAIAEALNVKVTQLLYLPLAAYTAAPSGTIPAFFAGMNHFFMYYYDGRTNQVTRSVLDITSGSEPGVFHVQMFMNVHDYDHYQLCENYYDGILTHYDALSLLVFQNQNMEMDRYQIGVPSPYMNTTTKWALAYGISSRPLMPTSTKVLLSKTIQQETPEFKKSLRLSKEDFRLMKLYNMLTVF
ncbi:MAG TPA: helix-turn-helix transcriptional regulator [Candidatus Faecousia faecavium]|nr:helix-turn-helix transcriptional regulator [Candidatus Faecousia faecavium]